MAATILVALFLLTGARPFAQTPRELFAEWKRQRITTLDPALVKHADLKKYLTELRAHGVPFKEVGRSAAGREIYQMEFGRGPLKVFMWSQMHGDEPTATTTLVDLFAYLYRNRNVAWVKTVEERVTLRAVPMLNPDGAELWRRRNLQSIDINRDARSLVTPEGRLLKQLRDDWRPDIGFNLHNQNPRTSVGDTSKQATISLLAVVADATRADTPGRVRNKKLCALMAEALGPFIYGHVGRYDDSFNPRAFGDLISQWGTPVILIETGALKGMSGHDLAGLNFVALATALRALADGSVEDANPAAYDALRFNESGLIYDLLVRGATVVNRAGAGGTSLPPYVADLAINVERGRGDAARPTRASVQDVGDLTDFRGLEEVDARDYYVVDPKGELRTGGEPTLLFYLKSRADKIEWGAPDLETRFTPDAVFRGGNWIQRGKLHIK